MMAWLKSILLLCLCFIICIKCDQLKVSVYYEALCPDSIRFVTQQLFPTYKLLGNDFDLDLVPFGKASANNENGKWEFTCQHGPRECYGNKVQACVYAQYSAPDSVLFVDCAMLSGHDWEDKYLENCTSQTEIKWTEVKHCLNSGRGDELMVANYEKTKAVTPNITFIPTITFNDVYSQSLQDNSLNDLQGVICSLLDNQPPQCNTEVDEPDCPTDEKLKISVYYEALCPDSVRFVRNQLFPTYNTLGTPDNFFNVDLVAYGFASANNESGKWEFTCQHGPVECYANKVQACIGDLYTTKENIDFLYCAMEDREWKDEHLEKCAIQTGVTWKTIKNCVASDHGDLLLVENGRKTAAVKPAINFIPTITLQGFYNQTLEDNILTNFKTVVCDYLNHEAPGCEHHPEVTII